MTFKKKKMMVVMLWIKNNLKKTQSEDIFQLAGTVMVCSYYPTVIIFNILLYFYSRSIWVRFRLYDHLIHEIYNQIHWEDLAWILIHTNQEKNSKTSMRKKYTHTNSICNIYNIYTHKLKIWSFQFILSFNN